MREGCKAQHLRLPEGALLAGVPREGGRLSQVLDLSRMVVVVVVVVVEVVGRGQDRDRNRWVLARRVAPRLSGRRQHNRWVLARPYSRVAASRWDPRRWARARAVLHRRASEHKLLDGDVARQEGARAVDVVVALRLRLLALLRLQHVGRRTVVLHHLEDVLRVCAVTTP